jgi:predicted ATP-grasp superfamily ATP-dependent carboligase
VPGGRVLLIADEYYASLAGVRALRAGGYVPIVGTITTDGYAQRSRDAAGSVLLPAPSDGEEPFRDALGEVIRDAGIAVVLPANEAALTALAGRDDVVEPASLAAPHARSLRRLTDKSALAEAAAEAGISTPVGVVVPPGGLDGVLGDITFPAVVKPLRSVDRDGAGGAVQLPRAARVEAAAELRARIEQAPSYSWLVQPFLQGALVAVAGVSYLGETLCTVHQRAHRIYPKDSGVSAFAETVLADDGLDERVRQLLATAGFTGVWQMQFITAPDGCRLIDFNPRLYGSLALAVAAGANLPAILIDAVLGREPQQCSYRAGVRYRSEMRELGVLTEALRDRDMRRALGVLMPHRRTTHAVVSLRDPAPTALLARRVLTRLRG